MEIRPFANKTAKAIHTPKHMYRKLAFLYISLRPKGLVEFQAIRSDHFVDVNKMVAMPKGATAPC
jgi:hypothetical protein